MVYCSYSKNEAERCRYEDSTHFSNYSISCLCRYPLVQCRDLARENPECRGEILLSKAEVTQRTPC